MRRLRLERLEHRSNNRAARPWISLVRALVTLALSGVLAIGVSGSALAMVVDDGGGSSPAPTPAPSYPISADAAERHRDSRPPSERPTPTPAPRKPNAVEQLMDDLVSGSPQPGTTGSPKLKTQQEQAIDDYLSSLIGGPPPPGTTEGPVRDPLLAGVTPPRQQPRPTRDPVLDPRTPEERIARDREALTAGDPEQASHNLALDAARRIGLVIPGGDPDPERAAYLRAQNARTQSARVGPKPWWR